MIALKQEMTESLLKEQQLATKRSTAFNTMDTNGDGVVDADEFKAAVDNGLVVLPVSSDSQDKAAVLQTKSQCCMVSCGVELKELTAVSSPEKAVTQTAEMNKMLARARKKFAQLDTDGNGLLEGRELMGLADWVWSCFHPGGKPLTDEEKEAEGAKLLGRLDADGDSKMSFEEFGEWFRRTCVSIQKFRRAQAVSPSATSSTSRRSNSSQSPARASSPNSPKVTALKQAQMARAASKASKAKAAQEAAKAISTASEAKVKGEASKKEAAATLKQASLSDDATAATACQTVRQMFEEADKNHNSILEANELAILMASMHRRVSVARKGNAAMARDGTKAILAQIEMLDTTRQGGLNFGQFCKVLNMEPWSALLPADISCQLLSTAAQAEEGDIKATSKPASYDWTDLTAPQLTQYLHQLFTIGDTNGDGVLQPKEFKKLMKLSGLNFPKEVIAKVCVQEKCMW